jgi:hypothetical protein
MPMKWIDSLAGYFGYEKVAQVKPTVNPQQINNQNPQLTNDQNLEPDPNGMPTNPPMGGVFPEQQSGNPTGPSGIGNGTPNPNSPIDPNGGVRPTVEINESVQVPNSFSPPNDKNTNSPVPPSLGNDLNPTQIKPQFTVDDLDNYHPKLGVQARKLGIKNLDKELFLEAYNEHIKKAAAKRQSLSEYFDEIL